MSLRKVEIIHDDPDAPPEQANIPVLAEPEDGGVAKSVALPPDFPAAAVAQGDGSFVLTLDYPVSLKWRSSAGEQSEVYNTLHLHRLNGRAQREIRMADPDAVGAQMIACSTGMTIGRARLLHDEMDASDITAVMRVIRFFTMPGRTIGR